MRFLLTLLFLSTLTHLIAQPEPCGPNPEMTSFCNQACVICDIDGFTGVNDLVDQGQPFPEFCTTQYNNLQYIAFIAGSEDLTIRVDVTNCQGGVFSLEVGFFETGDCENFTAIMPCDTDIESGESSTFSNFEPLLIGQHYYLVIDGSGGANCNWTFNVIEGTTEVLPLEDSGELMHIPDACVGDPIDFSTTGEVGAALYYWTIDGVGQNGLSQNQQFTFEEEGFYQICVTAANVCDQAPPTCSFIAIRIIPPTIIAEHLCEGECVTANGVDYCETGIYQDIITLPNGCDSLIVVDIEVFPQEEVAFDLWMCNGETFFIGTTPYTETGVYSETIQTVAMCDSTVNLDLLIIECEIIGSADEIPAICNGTATGTLIFSIDQGEPPMTYTYTNAEDASITGTGQTNILIDNEIPNVPAGLYQIYIEDNFGNDGVVIQKVTEPSVLAVEMMPSDYGGYNVSCFMDNGSPGADGTLSAEVSGGVPPYQYQWSDGQNLQFVTGLTYDTYSVTVTDEVGCTIEAAFTLTSAPPIEAMINFNDPNCDGYDTGSIELLMAEGGAPPYLYSLADSAYSANQTFTGLNGGNYTFHILDANGCVHLVDSNLTVPDIPEVSFSENLEIFLGDSTIILPGIEVIDLANVVWTDSSSLNCGNCVEPIARPFITSTYDLTVTSADGCMDTASIVIQVEERRRVFMPNIFSPNFDGINDTFLVYAGIEVEQINKLLIFDRWGNQLFDRQNFQPNDESLGWDGRFRGKKLDMGVYTWMAEVLYLDGVSIVYSGDVVLAE